MSHHFHFLPSMFRASTTPATSLIVTGCTSRRAVYLGIQKISTSCEQQRGKSIEEWAREDFYRLISLISENYSLPLSSSTSSFAVLITLSLSLSCFWWWLAVHLFYLSNVSSLLLRLLLLLFSYFPRRPPLSSERKCIASVLRGSCRDEHDHHSVIHSNRSNSSWIRSSSWRIQVKPSRASPLNLSKIELLIRAHHPVNQDVLWDKFYVNVSFSDASVVGLNNEPTDKGRRPRDDCQTVHFTSSINLTNSRRQSRKIRRNATLLSLSFSSLPSRTVDAWLPIISIKTPIASINHLTLSINALDVL